MRAVLITGASGFVGSALLRDLAGRGLQRLAAATRRSEVPSTWSSEAEPVRIEAIDGATDWREALVGVDTVLHLAARAHMLRDTAADPLAEFRRVNTEGTRRLAEEAARAGVRRFVYVSSIGVHGAVFPDGVRLTEDTPTNPSEPYAVSKLEAEILLREITARTGMELVILRPPLVYGPGNPGNFLRLLRLVETGLPLPLASVRNQRSFVYLDNLAAALRVCAEHPEAAGHSFLVSDGHDVSTPELLRLMAGLAGRPPRLFPFPPRLLRGLCALAGLETQFDKLCGSLCVDASHLRSVTGWSPGVSFEEGLRRTYRWYIESNREHRAE